MTTRWIITLVAIALLAACAGSKNGLVGLDTREPDLPMVDVGDEGSGADTAPGDGAQDEGRAEGEFDAVEAPDVATDVPDEADVALPPSVECSIVTAGGELAADTVSVTLADEPTAYLGTPGFQVDVVVRARNVEAGRVATLLLGEDEVATAPLALDPGTGGTAVTFQGVTLEHSLAGLALSVRLTNAAGLEGSCSKVVIVDTGLCGVALSPLPSDGCLLTDADLAASGFQVAFTVTSTSMGCTLGALDVAIGEAAPQTTDEVALDANGRATLMVTVSADEAGLNGLPVRVTALALSPSHPERTGASNAYAYRVDSEAPVVLLSAPLAGPVDLAADADGNPDNGVQIDVTGTVTGLNPDMPGDVLVLTTTAGVSQTLDEPGDTFLFDDVGFTADGHQVLTVTAVDACGREGAAQVEVDVFAARPQAVLVEPAEGGVLFAKNDQNLATAAYEADVWVQATDLPAGRAVSVLCGPATEGTPTSQVGRLDASPPPSPDAFAVPVVLDVDVLTHAVACVVTHDYPNASTSPERRFTLAMPAPTLDLLRPLEGRVTNKASLVVEATAHHLEGRALDLVVTGAASGVVALDHPAFATVANGGLYVAENIAALPDGSYVLALDGADGFGNVLSEQVGLDLDRSFSVDRTPPAVTLEGPAGLVFDDAVTPDKAPTVPGYQNTLTFRVSGEPVALGTTVCAAVHQGLPTCVMVTSADGVVAFPGVTFIAGANAVRAVATDAAGNASPPGDWVVTRVTSEARVEFAQPAHDTSVASPEMVVLVKVSSAVDAAPIDGATVTLLRDDVVLSSTSASGDGLYALPVTLQQGANRLQARAEVAGVTASSFFLTVTVKTGIPGATFLAPVDGAVFQASSPECAAGAIDCVTSVVANTLHAEDGSPATLTTLCGAVTGTYFALVTAGSVVFEDVVLLDQATCLLSIELTDALGTSAQTGPVTVRVDRVRPRLVAHDVPAYVLKKDDADPLTAGVQLRVEVTVSGLEAGRTITLTVADGAGPGTTTSLVTVAAVADDATAQRVFTGVTFPEGPVTFTFGASDLAGNAAVPLSGSTVVVASEPKVWIYQPAYVADLACATSAPCGAGACIDGQCTLVWNQGSVRSVQVGSQGLPKGAGISTNVRVCSSAAGPAAAACQTAGFGVITTALLTQDFAGVSLAMLDDGAHTLIVEALGDPLAGTWVTSQDEGVDPDQRTRRVYQDTAPPQTLGLSVPSDALAPEGVLNRNERSADGRFSIAVQGSEDGSARLFVNGASAAEAPLSGGVALFDHALGEGAASLQARVRDRAGNEGPLGPVPALSVTVDTVPPAVEFVNPVTAVLNQASSPDAIVRSGEAGARIALFDGAASLGTALTGADFRATFVDVLLADGTYALSATGTDGAGNSAQAVPPFASVLVDRTPPGLSVGQPVDLAVLDDADPAPGFQAWLSVATSRAVTWRVYLARGCSAAFSGCGPRALLFDGPVTNPDGAEPPVLRTFPGASSVYYVLTFEAEDDHGNLTTTQRRVTLDVSGCLVTFAELPDTGFVNTAWCHPAGQDCASASLDVPVWFLGTCPGVTMVELWEDGTAVASQPALDGRATFAARTYLDGRIVTLEARALAGDSVVAASAPVALTVDLKAPTVAFVSADVQGFTTPVSGSSPTYGLADDQDPGVADLQIHARLHLADTHLAGGSLDRLDSERDGVLTPLDVQAPVLPEVLDAATVDATVIGLTLAHGLQTVTATIHDAAGNVGKASFTANVDLQPPGPVTLEGLQPDETDRRLPRVVLHWTAPGDDGEHGQAVAYDVRFARSAITDDASFAAACPVEDVTALGPVAIPGAPGQPEALELFGPDVRPAPSDADPARCKFVVGGGDVTYSFAVRAIDDAGNVSSISSAQAVSTSELNVKTARLTFAGALLDEQMDRLFAPLGDVNGDGLTDVTTTSSTLGKACVFLGQNDGTQARDVPDLAFSSDVSAWHRCFAAEPGSSYVGVRAAGLGDIDGDGVNDWAMGYGTTPERIDVFLGRSTAPSAGEPPIAPAPFLRVRGQAYAVTPSASQVYEVGDFDGDGLADIGVGSRLTNVFYLLLLDGSFTGGDAPLWTPGSPPLEVDLNDPATYGSVRVVRVNLTGWTDATSYFGMNAARAGNMLPEASDDATPPGEVAIYQQNSPNQVFLVKGRAVPTSPLDLYVSAAYNGSAANNIQVVRFWREVGAVEGLFGIDLSGGTDLDGGGVPDLVIGHYSQAQKHAERPYAVYVIYGETIQGELGTRVNGVKLPNPTPTALGEGVLRGQYGVIVQGPYRRPAILGDFDGDALPDLVMHDLSATAWGEVWVRLNGVDAGAGFAQGTFPFVAPTLRSPYPSEPTEAYGNTAFPLSDFNGDGLPDILIGVKGGGFPTIVY